MYIYSESPLEYISSFRDGATAILILIVLSKFI